MLHRYFHLIFLLSTFHSYLSLSQSTKTSSRRTSPLSQRHREQRAAKILQLQVFYDEHQHTLIPKREYPELYKWMGVIRRNYRHQALHGSTDPPQLPTEELRQLAEVEFPWDLQEAIWRQRYQQLIVFQQEHGHCRVSPKDAPAGLGVWLRNQKRDARTNSMPAHRYQLLQDLGVEWYRSHEAVWEERYRELQAYYEQHGNADVPERYAANPALGRWCMNQRTAYRKYVNNESTALTPERIELLEQLSFRWNLRQYRWHSQLERLKQHHEQHGHIQIASSDTENRDLRDWLIFQRYYYHQRQLGLASPMSDRRIEAFERAIPGMAWKARESMGPSTEDWSKLFDAMREKGIKPGARPKQHWFEGMNMFSLEVKETWSEADLLALWNQAEDEEEDDDEGFNLFIKQ